VWPTTPLLISFYRLLGPASDNGRGDTRSFAPRGFHHRRRLALRSGRHNEAARGVICTASAACHLRNTANIGRPVELPQSGWRPAHASPSAGPPGGGGGRETLARRVHSIKHYPVTRSTGRFGLLGRRIRAPSSECRVLRRAIPGKFRATVNMA
jgi:hypothetical protein